MINNHTVRNFSINAFIMALAIGTLTISEGAEAARRSNVTRKITVKQRTNQIHRSTELFTNLRKNFNIKEQIEGSHEHKEVQKHVATYNRSKKILIKNTVHAEPHLQYVIGQVEKRKLPGEIALLPMLESNFKNTATSNRGAAGIWQIMPHTGKRFGLKTSGSYDGRRDVQCSTTAALNYLEYLNRKFKGDWMLTLAAYNAGEGTVERAMKRNRNAGKPTTFWHLNLPKQTKTYVPKFLALAKVMNQY